MLLCNSEAQTPFLLKWNFCCSSSSSFLLLCKLHLRETLKQLAGGNVFWLSLMISFSRGVRGGRTWTEPRRGRLGKGKTLGKVSGVLQMREGNHTLGLLEWARCRQWSLFIWWEGWTTRNQIGSWFTARSWRFWTCWGKLYCALIMWCSASLRHVLEEMLRK